MRFVEDEIVPITALECDLVLQYQLIRGDADVPKVVVEPTFALLKTLFATTVVGEDFEARGPLFELHFPVKNDGGGDDDEMWTPDFLLACEVCKERDSLDCFTTSGDQWLSHY